MSLPTRERELKQPRLGTHSPEHLSLPTRERELKHVARVQPGLVQSRSLHGSVN